MRRDLCDIVDWLIKNHSSTNKAGKWLGSWQVVVVSNIGMATNYVKISIITHQIVSKVCCC